MYLCYSDMYDFVSLVIWLTQTQAVIARPISFYSHGTPVTPHIRTLAVCLWFAVLKLVLRAGVAKVS